MADEPKPRGFWVDLMKTVGVPTAVLFYILMSISPKLDKLIELQTKVVTILENRSSARLRPSSPSSTLTESPVEGEGLPSDRK